MRLEELPQASESVADICAGFEKRQNRVDSTGKIKRTPRMHWEKTAVEKAGLQPPGTNDSSERGGDAENLE